MNNTNICLALMFFYWLSISSCCYAQSSIAGYEQYDSYKQNVYIDDLLNGSIPHSVDSLYYQRLKPNKIFVKIQELDTIKRERNLYLYSKGVGNGFLLVNSQLQNNIDKYKYDLTRISIVYVINENVVESKKFVKKLTTLNKKSIKKVEFMLDEYAKKLEVKIAIN